MKFVDFEILLCFVFLGSLAMFVPVIWSLFVFEFLLLSLHVYYIKFPTYTLVESNDYIPVNKKLQ